MPRAGLIDSLFDSKLALGIAGIAAVAIGVMGVVLWQRPAPAPAPAPARAGSWSDPIGPGLLSGTARDRLPLSINDMRDVKIAVDGAGHLVPDLALRKLLDEFLLRPAPADRPAMERQLRSLLSQRLEQPAAGEADRLVTAYAAYLRTEAQMRANERFTAANPGGLTDQQVRELLAWQGERAALRERMLGTGVANAWFAEEDGNCKAVLKEWETQLAPPADDDSVEQMSRRRFGDVLAQRRNSNAQACAAQIEESAMAPHG